MNWRDKLNAFIHYFNETFAKQMNWTYTGHLASSLIDQRPRTWREKWMAMARAA